MSARHQIAEQLTADLPTTWRVIEDGRPIGAPGSAVLGIVAVERDRIEPAPNYQGSYFETLFLWVIEPTTNATTSEDALDDRLEAVLDIVYGLRWMTFQQAERGTFQEVYAAYKITVQVVTHKE